MEEITIERAFAAAMRYSESLHGRGFQIAICKTSGVDASNLNSIIKKDKGASEQVRRKIFENTVELVPELPVIDYEDFLNLGRWILEGNSPDNYMFEIIENLFDKTSLENKMRELVQSQKENEPITMTPFEKRLQRIELVLTAATHEIVRYKDEMVTLEKIVKKIAKNVLITKFISDSPSMHGETARMFITPPALKLVKEIVNLDNLEKISPLIKHNNSVINLPKNLPKDKRDRFVRIWQYACVEIKGLKKIAYPDDKETILEEYLNGDIEDAILLSRALEWLDALFGEDKNKL